MKTWKNFFPLFHDPFNRRFLKLVGRSEYKLTRATIQDIQDAFECTWEEAKEAYRTGVTPPFRGGQGR